MEQLMVVVFEVAHPESQELIEVSLFLHTR